jgi:hypothetical protein
VNVINASKATDQWQPPQGSGADSASGVPSVTAHCHCGHEPNEHDVVASRYCTATETWILDRGCICRPLPPRPLGNYNR